MRLKYRENLKTLSRDLRSNPTGTEIKLWLRLKNRQLKGFLFNRQRPIGDYIVDFYCAKAKLVIEIDGGEHCEEKNIKRDIIRDEYLEKLGLKVLRFTNIDVSKNIDNVLENIYEILPALRRRLRRGEPNPPFTKEGIRTIK